MPAGSVTGQHTYITYTLVKAQLYEENSLCTAVTAHAQAYYFHTHAGHIVSKVSTDTIAVELNMFLITFCINDIYVTYYIFVNNLYYI